MSMNTSNKSRLGRKIFEISSQLENMPINSPSVTDHFSHYDEWCGKAVASNSTLNLNTKYLLMQEIINCVEYNKIYSPLKTGFLQEGPKMACKGTAFSANRKFYDPNTIVDLMLPPFIMFSSYERDSSVYYQRNVLRVLVSELGLSSEIQNKDMIFRRYGQKNDKEWESVINTEIDTKIKEVVKLETIWDDTFSPEKKIVKAGDIFFNKCFGVNCKVNFVNGVLTMVTRSPNGLRTGINLSKFLLSLDHETKVRQEVLDSEGKVDASIQIHNKSKTGKVLTLYHLGDNGSFVRVSEVKAGKPREEPTY